MKIEVLVGMIASGKSVYARKRADEGWLVINHDSLTQMVHGGDYRYEQGLRECYRRMEESIAWEALTVGRNVIIDRCHLTIESRRRWIEWAGCYDSLNTFDGHGPTTRVVAVAFPIEYPEIHAARRWSSDHRGRSFDEWMKVAKHHYDQAQAEPLSDGEGFAEIIQPEDLFHA